MSYASHQLSSSSISNQNHVPHIFPTIIEHVVLIKQEKDHQAGCYFSATHEILHCMEMNLPKESRLYCKTEMNIPRLKTEASQSKSDRDGQKYSDILNISIRQSVQSFPHSQAKVMAKNVALSGFGIWP